MLSHNRPPTLAIELRSATPLRTSRARRAPPWYKHLRFGPHAWTRDAGLAATMDDGSGLVLVQPAERARHGGPFPAAFADKSKTGEACTRCSTSTRGRHPTATTQGGRGADSAPLARAGSGADSPHVRTSAPHRPGDCRMIRNPCAAPNACGAFGEPARGDPDPCGCCAPWPGRSRSPRWRR